MKRKNAPANGSVFLVPLPIAGYGIGVLVRADLKGRAYGLFFGPCVTGADEVKMSELNPQKAVLRCRFGDHGLHTRRWVVVGSIPDWDASAWALPRFARPHDDPNMCYVSKYDDNLNLLTEAIVPAHESQGMPEDAQFGSGVIEVKLAKLLAQP